MGQINKARYWCGVLYQENMLPNWEEDLGDILQLPYAYCAHDKDKDTLSEHRKDHVHMIIVFNNTTTYKHALSVLDLLSAPGKKAINKVEAVVNIRSMYDYLIHNTETCKKKGKYLYPNSCRKTGNNFDIGAFEQISIAEKNDMCKELCDVIISECFVNFAEFYMYVISNYEDTNYFEVIKSYSGLYERLTKANYQKYVMFNKKEK